MSAGTNCTRLPAARAAAARVSQELGDELGGLVGYQVRGESRTSNRTRIRFVTEGVQVDAAELLGR